MTQFTKNAVVGGYFLFVALAVAYVAVKSSQLGVLPYEGGVSCSMEAKLCPDGSAVGRGGPSCEFAPCPDSKGGGMKAGEGTISGKVSIGPLCPVEPCRGGMMSNPYIGREIVLRSPDGKEISARLDDEGNFKVIALAGTYSMNLSNCLFMGCARVLPQTVTLEAGKTTQADINIDTGIR